MDDIIGAEPGEDFAPEELAEKAFKEAKAGYTLFGDPLAGYSPSRKVAAQTMGLLYPYVGEDGSAQMERTGLYPGVLKDTIIVLWLCTLKDPSQQTREDLRAGEWNPSRAFNSPREALEEAIRWGESKGIIETSSDRFQVAMQTFQAIVTGVTASEFTIHVVDKDGTEIEGSEEDEGPKV